MPTRESGDWCPQTQGQDGRPWSRDGRRDPLSLGQSKRGSIYFAANTAPILGVCNLHSHQRDLTQHQEANLTLRLKDKTVSETQWSREWGLAAARQITVPSLPQLTLANFEGIVLRLVDICLHALMRPPRTLCRPWFASTPMPGSRLGFGRCRLQHPHSFCPFCRGQHARNRLPLRGTGQHGRCGVGRGSTVSVYARSQVFGI